MSESSSAPTRGRDRSKTNTVEAAAPGCVGDEFLDYINERAAPLLALAGICTRQRATERHDPLVTWQRPFLGNVLAESSYLEELLDACGARRNEAWFVFREYMAGMKLFSGIAYKLLHLYNSASRYRLGKKEGDFLRDTRDTAAFVCRQLECIMSNARRYALEELAVQSPPREQALAGYQEELPCELLPATRKVRRVGSAREAAVQVATTFLQRSATVDILRLKDKKDAQSLTELVPATVNEEMLSRIENTFHNMQTHYDTHITDTETENIDADLPSLRGHVSVIFHLLETAVAFLHFYERHLAPDIAKLPQAFKCPVDSEQLLERAFSYSIQYADDYLGNAQTICRGILKRYSEVTEVEVPIPAYRGFHVRPSTLIAKIVHHYGCEVTMQLMGDTYDASKPLELFRANEQINAIKRRRLAEKLDQVPLKRLESISDVKKEVRRVVLKMAETDELIIYEHPLPVDELKTHEGEWLEQYVADQISRLLARGTIDIEADITVTFRGDKRMLADIRCLAENGYGEDRFGNNVPLPRQLSYLHRDQEY